MTDEQYKALRQLMLEQNSKIAELTLEVRRLSEAVTTTEVVYVEENRVGTEQLEELLRIRQSPEPHSDNE
ncbi:hypothetical protein [Agrobacterium tumefaciens]|uniref:hypothetical protein n=1 Tax=Agrobacterium tumefaciens TaxID=358 RepID=UPI0012971C3C|nr:hypothetical protein [Agrobacterium tumefaciens]